MCAITDIVQTRRPGSDLTRRAGAAREQTDVSQAGGASQRHGYGGGARDGNFPCSAAVVGTTLFSGRAGGCRFASVPPDLSVRACGS